MNLKRCYNVYRILKDASEVVMDSVFSLLYRFSISEYPQKNNRNQELILDKLLYCEDALLKSFSNEQKAWFVQYREWIDQYHMDTEDDAFRRGFMLAVKLFGEIDSFLVENI